MSQILLITVRKDERAHTYAFDTSVQSVLHLGEYGWVESNESGAILHASAGGWLLTREGDGQKRMTLDLMGLEERLIYVRRVDDVATLYVRPATRGIRTFRSLWVPDGVELEIGRGQACDIRYASPLVSVSHARLCVSKGVVTLHDLQSANGTYRNGTRVAGHQPIALRPGDVVQILDLIVCVGAGLVSLNCPEAMTIANPKGMRPVRDVAAGQDHDEEEPCAGDAFYPAPRLSKSIRPFAIEVDAPPTKKEEDRQPAIMQVGPSFLMGFSSVFMGMGSLSRMMSGADVLSTAPSLAMAVAMVGGSVVWPLVSRSYTRKRNQRDEMLRVQTYVAYLDGIENALEAEASRQAQILRENRRPVRELLERAASLSPLLMNRTSEHDDFMELRVGVGETEVVSDMAWPKRRFSLAQDLLLNRVDELARHSPTLRDVPLAFDPARHFVSGVLGNRAEVWEFVRGIVVQACALYSYHDLKVVVVGSEEERLEWDFVTSLRHAYGADGKQRLVALGHSGLATLDTLVEREIELRSGMQPEVLGDFGTYYMVICSNVALAERSQAISHLIKCRSNLGFSLIYMGRNLHDLPRECAYIIDLAPKEGVRLDIALDECEEEEGRRRARMFERSDVSGTLVNFDPDIYVTRDQARTFALALSRARLDEQGYREEMPESLGYLEMYGVGSVGHLGIGKRWAEHDASRSLGVAVGIDSRGETFHIDLHESVHGPHALIAGTTGSGKSELIIAYILSLCSTYSPDEVAFVLIDYKGGGLAGAFESERHHLPHLAGTITNLDGASIRRSLVSIQSELQRRQRLFREACERTGEPTMDIYKYLSAYRQGILAEPLPHLFVVADEFAELKHQEPEFMSELVSAARIGRSLGVHLILATQKPTGVVDDQIWSNARTKISLKVSDAADSRELIRRDDAAELSRPGQFYMLVGYNESFSSGQAAYAGGRYVETENFEPRRDRAVELLDAEGRTRASQRLVSQAPHTGQTEIEAVLEKIEECARATGKHARRLWLDPLPAVITLDDLSQRYAAVNSGNVCCTVGELDDPERQRKLLFEVDLSRAGNVMIYGSQSSDCDGLVACMLVSLCLRHPVRDVWVYGIDAGLGRLGALGEFPHVGGVVRADDDERIHNLVRMLEREMEHRRDLLASGGSLEAGLPHVVVAIVNLGLILERYENLEDKLVSLTRDAPRYGMTFLVTAATAGTPRMRFRANFSTSIVGDLNDEGDYSAIFGSMAGIAIPHGERRGLTKVGKRILEFQGARVSAAPKEEGACIKKIARERRAKSEGAAKPIPVLPRHVMPVHMQGVIGEQLVPVGFLKSQIRPVCFDASGADPMLVLGDSVEPIGAYLRGMRDSYAESGCATYCFVDPQQVLGAIDDSCVLQDIGEVAKFVRDLCAGSITVSVLVFSSIVQTIQALPPEEREMLEAFFSEERYVRMCALVVASELWRTKGLYQEWYRVVSAYGNGVWVGSGFADQTAFRYAHSLPEYRRPALQADGFLVVRGAVQAVRLVEQGQGEGKR